MSVEKKLVAISTVAILIGVISIVPILFLNEGVVKAEITVDKPWSTLSIPYAYCNPYADYSNITNSYRSSLISAVGNIGVSGDALKNAIGRIEYYQLQVYSDQDQIYNMTYYVGLFKSDQLVNIHKTTLFFANGNSYSTNVTNGNGGIIINGIIDQSNSSSLPFNCLLNGGTTCVASENLPQEIIDLREAQKLYIDVYRLCSFTFNENSTIATVESNEVIQHIELTKTDNTFLYGSTANLSLPFPVDQPTPSNPPKIFTPITPNNSTIPFGNQTTLSP